MSWFFDMISAAFYAILVQNLVFSGGYGASEAVRMASKPKKLASTVTAVVCRALDFLPWVAQKNQSIHFLIFALVLISVYFITGALIYFILKPSKRLMTKLGIAAINTLALAIPLINYRSAANFWESIGTGFGSGIAFVIASLLISVGFTRIAHNKHIPPVFRGTPVLFIYVAMLSLTFMGISGSNVFA